MLRTSDNLPYTMMPTEDTSQATRPDQTAPSAIKANDAKPSPEADDAEVENDNKKLELSRLMARFPTLSNTIWWFEISGFCKIPGKPSCCATYLAPALQWMCVIYAHVWYPLKVLYIDYETANNDNNYDNNYDKKNDLDNKFDKNMRIVWIMIELTCCFCHMTLLVWSRSMAWNILVHVLKFFENKDDTVMSGIVGSRLKSLGRSMMCASLLVVVCLIVQLYWIHSSIQSTLHSFHGQAHINMSGLVQLLVLCICWPIMALYLSIGTSFENFINSIMEDCKDPELNMFKVDYNLADEI